MRNHETCLPSLEALESTVCVATRRSSSDTDGIFQLKIAMAHQEKQNDGKFN